METSVNEAIIMRHEDRSYLTHQKKSNFPFVGIAFFLLLLLLGGMGFLLYTHHTQLTKMQDWLSGDADNLEQIGNRLLERSVGLENDIANLQTSLEKTNGTLKKAQIRANNNRRVNNTQADSLKNLDVNMTSVTGWISEQETKTAQIDSVLVDITNQNAEQDSTLKALKAVDSDFLSFQKSTNNFRTTTNTTVSDINQQLNVIRARLDQIEQRAVRHERLLVTMQREQKQMQQRLQQRLQTKK